MQKEQLDFLAIGDVVIDAFIELLDAQVTCNIDHENCTISMRWGDKIPYKDVEIVKAVGNSANASVAAARLGLKSGLLAYVGDDEYGNDCCKTLENENVSTTYITREAGKKTNYHYVLRYGAERTILVKHEEFSYSLSTDLPAPRYIYLSSIADNTIPFHEELADYLEAHPTIQFAFQPGTFQMKLGLEKLQRLYERSDIFFCNKEEAERILSTTTNEINYLLKRLHQTGPKLVVITDGPAGAYTYDGNESWHIAMYPDPKAPIDRTGAGDAFSSTFVVARALGKTVPEALSWGPINSMSVVQYIGAQKGLLARPQIEEYLRSAPEHYKPVKLS